MLALVYCIPFETGSDFSRKFAVLPDNQGAVCRIDQNASMPAAQYAWTVVQRKGQPAFHPVVLASILLFLLLSVQIDTLRSMLHSLLMCCLSLARLRASSHVLNKLRI
jgi:hypothetical protein